MREPTAPRQSGPAYRFGVFDFDAGTLELRRHGRIVRVRPQSLRLLTLILERSGQLVPRDDIGAVLWGTGTFVDFEQGVNHCIRELRAALGDSAESPRYIETLPRRGYRFIAQVERVDNRVPTRAAVLPGPRRSWAAAALLVAGVSALLMVGYARRPPPRGVHPVPVLSIAPFATAGVDPALGAGLAIAISTRLGAQHLVPVRLAEGAGTPLSGERPAKGSPTHLLSGEIGGSASEVTVLARLTQSAGGAVVWSHKFRVQADELFSIEHVIAERVVSSLSLRLAAADRERLRQRYTRDAAAYEAYLRGRAAAVKYTAEGTLDAIHAFESALERDSAYALARAGLAMACADMYLRFAPAGEIERWGDRSDTEARAALDLDPALAEAHLARAAVARKREFDWNATLGSSRRALALNPNLDQAHFFIAAAYYHHGFMEEALIETERGRDLRGPDAVEPARAEALVALFSGSFTAARVHLEHVSRSSSQAIGDTYLALAYYYTGSVAQGRTMLESLASHRSASTASRAAAALAGVLASEKEAVEARRYIDRVLTGSYRDHHVAYSLGAAYAQLGDTDDAVRWLRTAADTGFPCLTWFERDPLLEPLRRSDKFSELRAHVVARRAVSLASVNR